MPMLIQHIDEIARELQRDVLYLVFCKEGFSSADDFELVDDWENCKVRQYLVQWFADDNIEARPCAGVSNSGWICGYSGHLYIDVPFDRSNLDYLKIENLLENEDGSMKLRGVVFCVFGLEEAVRIAESGLPE